MTPGEAASVLYDGEVMHRRLLPFAHRFRYRIATFLLDLDALPALDRRLRLFAHNRAGVFSVHDRDHGPRDGTPLRPWIEGHCRAAGIDLDGGPIGMLCLPRILGFVFNPITVYFCHDRAGALRAVLYEVRNTFGDLHGYLVPVPARGRADPDDDWIRQDADKVLHVSPFLPVDGRYRFRLRPPGERLTLLIRLTREAGDTMVATLTGHRRALSDRALLRVLVVHPLLTLKVIAAIHWQALRLWAKGAAFHRRPDPPTRNVTYHAET